MYEYADADGVVHSIEYTNIQSAVCRSKGLWSCTGTGAWKCACHEHRDKPPAIFVGALGRVTPERFVVECPEMRTIPTLCLRTETKPRRGGTKRKRREAPLSE